MNGSRDRLARVPPSARLGQWSYGGGQEIGTGGRDSFFFRADLATTSFVHGVVSVVTVSASWLLAAHGAASVPTGVTKYGTFLVAALLVALAGLVVAVASLVMGLVARSRMRQGWEYEAWRVRTAILTGSLAVLACLLLSTYSLFAYSFRIEF